MTTKQLPEEFVQAKTNLHQATIHHADCKFAYDMAKAEYEALMDQVGYQTRQVKSVFDKAKETFDKAEEHRAEVFETFKATSRNDPKNSEIKEALNLARINKNQTETTKKLAQTQLDLARAPFKDRIVSARQARDEAFMPFHTTKVELTAAVITFQIVCRKYFSESDALIIFDEEMRQLTMEIMSSRKTINSLEAWLKTGLAILRDFVGTNPIGFTNGDLESQDGYPIWIDQADSVMVILEDNPTYYVFRDRLIDLIGQEAFLQLVVKISHSVVEKAIEAGTLVNKKTGEKMTLDELKAITIVDQKTPRVKVSGLGSVRKADLELLITPEFLSTPIAQAEQEGSLPPGTTEELGQQGITTIRQIVSQGIGQITTKLIGKEKANALFGMLERFRR